MVQFKAITVSIFLALVLFAGSAKAYSSGGSSSGFVFKPSLMYLYDAQTGTNGSGVTTTRTLVDLGLGYRFSTSPFYVGGIYTYDNTANTGNSSAKNFISGYGATIGMITDNVHMLFSYYLSSQYDVTSSGGTTTSYSSGSGFALALGYTFSLGGSFRLGPEFTYRTLQYTQVKSSTGTTSSASLTVSTLVPYVTMMFGF